MKKIVLFDNYQGGHHLSYLQLFSKNLFELGFEVWVFCCQSEKLYSWVKSRFPEHLNSIKVFEVSMLPYPKLPLIGNLPRTFSVLNEWRYAAQTIHQAVKETGQKPDLIFFAWLDSYLSPYLHPWLIEKIFPYYWSGLYFTPFYLREGERFLPIIGKPVSIYNLIHSSHCKGLGMLNEVEVKRLKAQFEKPIELFPDFTDESKPDKEYEVAQQIRLVAGGRTTITLIGALSARKGVMTLLETAHRLQSEAYYFVFAGLLEDSEFEPEDLARIKKIVQSQPDNCYFHFARISTEAQFNAVIDASDILFAAYRNFPFSSNLITKAAVFEKPIIVSKGYSMAAAVEAYNLGLAIPEEDIESCINAIKYLEDSLESGTTNLQPDFASYRAKNSEIHLQETFKKLFCSCHDSPITPPNVPKILS